MMKGETVMEKPEKNELTSEDMEKVNGGALYTSYDTNGTEVIDDGDGHVITKFVTHGEAAAYAQEHGISTKNLYWCELEQLRNKNQ